SAASRTAHGAARLDTPGYVTSLWSRGQINHIRGVTGAEPSCTYVLHVRL
ncbi:hypothetical protein LSAT2_006495, partial [Lamellibrachia satsuma]